MMLYLAGHTHPHITHAAPRYMFFPRFVHKHALKKIGCYQKSASGKGLIMKPSEKLLKIDSVSDAMFAGVYGHEAMDNPVYD
ncbi:hypothetical protein ACHAXS_000192 [Conticribra weissflogii]